MLYPENCLERLGFLEIKNLVAAHCLSAMGRHMVEKMQLITRFDQIDKFLNQTKEFKEILEIQAPLHIHAFHDLKHLTDKIKVEGTYLLEEGWHQLHTSLQTVFSVLHFFEERPDTYPALEALFEHLPIEKLILKHIAQVIDEKGKVKANASPLLQDIISQRNKAEQEVRNKMDAIYKQAVKNNWVADGSLTVRDGRICIPVLAENKRKLKGFVHDESASGQTVYMEPEEVFSLNNKLRDLEFEQRREIIRILIELSTTIRPYIPLLLKYHGFLTKLDFVRAKALFALDIEADKPIVLTQAKIKLSNARHPLLYLSFKAEYKSVSPLNIAIDEHTRMVLVSGPNAGGKSVCMKTVGLLQIMLQCGLLIPADPHSEMGIFTQVFADIGDDQSIESDLSTYSAHLKKMKHFVEFSNAKTLILIDEFGTGTDPQYGGPMAEAVLEALNEKKARGVITTHYSNLKLFAGNTSGLENASMLFDNRKMQPLYILEMGKPGSSYAFEIAQNIGLPKQVLELAKAKIGENQNRLDHLLVNLERDKKEIYDAKIKMATLQNKLKQLVEENERQKLFLEENKKALIKEAKLEAQNIIKNANKLVEHTISEIKSKQAEKSQTKVLRAGLEQALKQHTIPKEEKKVIELSSGPIELHDWVKLNDSETLGQVLEINKNDLVLAIGELRSVVKKNRVQKVSHKQAKKELRSTGISTSMTDAVSSFKAEIDLRGMRTEDALYEVEKYLDRAIMMGFPSLKLIHGRGDGILRKMIREYLKKYSEVNRMEDEHADRGGDGITYVYLN